MADLFAQAENRNATTGVWFKAQIVLAGYRLASTIDLTIVSSADPNTSLSKPLPNSITTSTSNKEDYIGRLFVEADGSDNTIFVTNAPNLQFGTNEFKRSVENSLAICIRVNAANDVKYEIAMSLGSDRTNIYSDCQIIAYRGFEVTAAGDTPTNAEISAAFVALGGTEIVAGDTADILLVDSSNPGVDIATFSYTNPLLVGVQQGILNAVLFKAASSVLVTNYDQDVTFDGETYVADRSLLAVDGPSSGGDFPRYSFDIACREGSPQHTLFAPGSGPEPASILLVTSIFDDITGALTWGLTWSFVGILGEGAMVEGAYSGIIQHPFEYRLHALTKKYWSARALRSANASDAGGDHVATISRKLLSAWQGSQMEPAK